MNDPVLTILADHGERLTSIEGDLDEIKDGINEIKEGPIYNLDRHIKRKVAEAGGFLGIIMVVTLMITQS
jgi:hypothetical protein